MAFTSNYSTIPGLLAGANLSSSQYKVVKLASTAGEVVLAGTSVLTTAAGVLMNDPADGEAALVAYAGVAKVIAGTSAITAGAPLGVNTTSQVVNTTTDNASIIGRALTAASASGDYIEVLLIPGGIRY